MKSATSQKCGLQIVVIGLEISQTTAATLRCSLSLSHEQSENRYITANLTILAAIYRSVEAPAQQNCRKIASESAGAKGGAEESAEKAL